jgi:hypothetical protein
MMVKTNLRVDFIRKMGEVFGEQLRNLPIDEKRFEAMVRKNG